MPQVSLRSAARLRAQVAAESLQPTRFNTTLIADKGREAAASSPEDTQLTAQLTAAQHSNEQLRRELAQLRLLLDKTQQRQAAQRAARHAAHAAELQHLSQQNRILETFLQQASDARIDIGLPAAAAGQRG